MKSDDSVAKSLERSTMEGNSAIRMMALLSMLHHVIPPVAMNVIMSDYKLRAQPVEILKESLLEPYDKVFNSGFIVQKSGNQPQDFSAHQCRKSWLASMTRFYITCVSTACMISCGCNVNPCPSD